MRRAFTTCRFSARIPRTLLVAATLSLLASSCSLFSSLSRATHGKPSPASDTARLEVEVRRLSDEVILESGRAMRRLSKEVGTPEAHLQTVSWSVSHTNRVLSIASNPRPLPALVDLYLFVSVQRALHEGYWLPSVYHEADRPLFEAYQRLEQDCWHVVSSILDPKQQEDLRTIIADWKEQNPDLRQAATLEAPSFAESVESTKSKGGVPIVSGLLDLLNIDPLSDLEPAVREVATTRETGERMFFFAQHMPQLMAQEAELYTLRTANLPEVKAALKDVERITQSTESFTATVAALPDNVRAEREATLKQIADELSAQRRGLIEDLEKAESPLQSLLKQSRETFDAGTQTSKAVQEVLVAIDKLGSHPAAEVGDGAVAKAPSRPFDVTEYGDAAARIGDAAHELTVAITAVDQDMPRLEKTLNAAAARADETVDRAFWRALILAFCVITFTAFTVIVVRAVARKSARRASSS